MLHVQPIKSDPRERPESQKNRRCAAPREPLFGSIDVVVAEPEVSAPSVHNHRPCPAPHRPCQVATHDIAEGTGGHHDDNVQTRSRECTAGQRAAEQHGHLRGHRNARRLHQHQDEDRQIPEGDNQMLHSAPSPVKNVRA